MEGRDDARPGGAGTDAQEPGQVLYDRGWAREVSSSARCAAGLLAMLLLIDWASGAETLWRAALWCALALLLFLVLCPRRVSAGEGWFASRGLLRTRRVRTDLLVSVHCLEGVSQRLVLRDADGGQVEVDPQVLVENPDLWHRLHEDARTSAAHGLLLCGATALHRLEERIDRETALTVFKVSGLE